jgi:hypothetical protein
LNWIVRKEEEPKAGSIKATSNLDIVGRTHETSPTRKVMIPRRRNTIW